MSRYSTAMILRAQELHAAGWNHANIASLLGREFDMQAPTRTTVRSWVDDAYADSRRRRNAAARRRARRANGITWLYQGATADTKWHRIKVLAEHGLTIRQIVILMRIDYGLELTYNQVRYALLIDEPPTALRSAQKATA